MPLEQHAAFATAHELPIQATEPVAQAEHERWRQALESDGWRWGPGSKDPERKLHPCLVTWDELPEDEREKDRDAIRRLPEILAGAGYTLAFADDGPVDALTGAGTTRPPRQRRPDDASPTHEHGDASVPTGQRSAPRR